MNRVASNGYNFQVYLDLLNEHMAINNRSYRLGLEEDNTMYYLTKFYPKTGITQPCELGIVKTKDEMSEYIDGLYRGFQLFG